MFLTFFIQPEKICIPRFMKAVIRILSTFDYSKHFPLIMSCIPNNPQDCYTVSKEDLSTLNIKETNKACSFFCYPIFGKASTYANTEI